MSNEKKRLGLDLVDLTPSYSQPWDKYWKEYRERHFKAYGEYPPEPEKSKK